MVSRRLDETPTEGLKKTWGTGIHLFRIRRSSLWNRKMCERLPNTDDSTRPNEEAARVLYSEADERTARNQKAKSLTQLLEITRNMSSHNWLGLALAGLLVATAALGGAEDKSAADVKKLEGKWTAPSGDGGTVSYTFKGKTLKIEAPTRTYDITISIDPAAKPEKTIDLKIDEAPEDAKGKTSKGIYKFDGEKVVLCFRPEGERPTKFEQVGFEQILVELTRVKG
jgi:uncharacterized protein (TIGR03067 family)